MTQDEARERLNSMLVPFDSEKANIKANEGLSADETKLLLQIVSDFEDQCAKYDYKQALKDVANIMSRYVKESTNTRKNVKIALQPEAMPFLIQQVLFFIAASCKVYKIKCTQTDIIRFLKAQGVSISHNFFSRMHTTPTQYVSMIKHKQPKLPCNYKGQKKGVLAAAIKNLVYQAGKYHVFCDIFGGSGAATLAVDRRKDSIYVYNELDPVVCNLFKVMSKDTMYLELIDELKNLQLDLKNARGGTRALILVNM